MKQLEEKLSSWSTSMTKREHEFLELKKVSTKYEFQDGEIIKLNVGGVIFAVSKETLTQKLIKPSKSLETTHYDPNYFNSLVSGLHNLIKDSNDESIFIDRDPTYFRYILNYLRSGGDVKNFVLPSDNHALESLFVEARYYSMDGLTELISKSHQQLISKYLEENVETKPTTTGFGFGSTTFGSKPLIKPSNGSGFNFGGSGF